MKAVLDPRAFSPSSTPSIVTIGVFDGVHLGHQAILRETLQWAKSQNAQSVVLTFRRHPELLLQGQSPPAVTSLEHRLVLLERFGIDLTVVLSFDEDLREMSAEQFCEKWFVKNLRAKGVVLGPDNAIGKNREGNLEKLQEIGSRLGFAIRQIIPAQLGKQIVSSTAIRQALQSGDLTTAAAMLGRTPSIYGTVIHGDDRGHRLGFPTANLNLHHEFTPSRGVYFGWTEIAGKKIYCVLNVGRRPTFKKDEAHDIAEAHLLDFEGELYGNDLEVHLLEKLREEKKFPDSAALKKQIEADILGARKRITALQGG